MTEVCERYKINESDLMRRAVATFVEDLNNRPDDEGKYLFVWCIQRIYNGYYIALDRSFLSLRSFVCLSKKDENEGAFVVV